MFGGYFYQGSILFSLFSYREAIQLLWVLNKILAMKEILFEFGLKYRIELFLGAIIILD